MLAGCCGCAQPLQRLCPTLLADEIPIAAAGRHPPELLKDVRASFSARTFSAIIGQSGSGKTTLLNILSGRGGGTFRGSIACNGVQNVSSKALKHIASLVPQHDDMYDILTARETLSIYAALRGSTSKRVSYLLDRLGLAYAADVRIGNALRPGLSGGQRKRLSVAIELLDSPSLLFADGTPRLMLCTGSSCLTRGLHCRADDGPRQPQPSGRGGVSA